MGTGASHPAEQAARSLTVGADAVADVRPRNAASPETADLTCPRRGPPPRLHNSYFHAAGLDCMLPISDRRQRNGTLGHERDREFHVLFPAFSGASTLVLDYARHQLRVPCYTQEELARRRAPVIALLQLGADSAGRGDVLQNLSAAIRDVRRSQHSLEKNLSLLRKSRTNPDLEHTRPYPDSTRSTIALCAALHRALDVQARLPAEPVGRLKVISERLARFTNDPALAGLRAYPDLLELCAQKRNPLFSLPLQRLQSITREQTRDWDRRLDYDDVEYTLELIEKDTALVKLCAQLYEVVQQYHGYWRKNADQAFRRDAQFLRHFPERVYATALVELDYYVRLAGLVRQHNFVFADLAGPGEGLSLEGYRCPWPITQDHTDREMDFSIKAGERVVRVSGAKSAQSVGLRALAGAVLGNQCGFPLNSGGARMPVFPSFTMISAPSKEAQQGLGNFAAGVKSLVEGERELRPRGLVVIDHVPSGSDDEAIHAVSRLFAGRFAERAGLLIFSGAELAEGYSDALDGRLPIVTRHIRALPILVDYRNRSFPAPAKYGSSRDAEQPMSGRERRRAMLTEAGFSEPTVRLFEQYYKILAGFDRKASKEARAQAVSALRNLAKSGLPQERDESGQSDKRNVVWERERDPSCDRLLDTFFPRTNFTFGGSWLQFRDTYGDPDFCVRQTRERIEARIAAVDYLAQGGADRLDGLATALRAAAANISRLSESLRSVRLRWVFWCSVVETSIPELTAVVDDLCDALGTDPPPLLRDIQERLGARTASARMMQKEPTSFKPEVDPVPIVTERSQRLQTALEELQQIFQELDILCGIARPMTQNRELHLPIFVNEHNIFRLQDAAPWEHYDGSRLKTASNPFIADGTPITLRVENGSVLAIIEGPNGSGKTIGTGTGYLDAWRAVRGLPGAARVELTWTPYVDAYLGGGTERSNARNDPHHRLSGFARVVEGADPGGLAFMDEVLGVSSRARAAIQLAALHVLSARRVTVICNMNGAQGLRDVADIFGVSFHKTDVKYDSTTHELTYLYSLSPDREGTARSLGFAVALKHLPDEDLRQELRAIHEGR